MKKYYCDIPNCNEEAWERDLDVCNGYKLSSESRDGTIEYKPFEKPHLEKVDLCEKHFTEWCKLTYQLYKENKE